jgi:hypothetical protein
VLNAHVDHTGWLRDEERFTRYLNLDPPGRLRFVPNQYEGQGESGFVAGTVLDELEQMHVSNFLLALRRAPDGEWRVAADSTTPRSAPPYREPVTAETLVSHLDRAGIAQALVLSEAFWLGGDDRRDDARLEERRPTLSTSLRSPSVSTTMPTIRPSGGHVAPRAPGCARGRSA